MIDMASIPSVPASTGARQAPGRYDDQGSGGFASYVDRNGGSRPSGRDAGEAADSNDRVAGGNGDPATTEGEESASTDPARRAATLKELEKALDALLNRGKAGDGDEATAAEEDAPLGSAEEDDVDDEKPAGDEAALLAVPVTMREHRTNAKELAPEARSGGADAQAAAEEIATGDADEGADTRQSGGEGDGEAEPGRRRNAGETGDMRVRVVSDTVSPAPAPAQNQRTIAGLAASLAGDAEWKGAVDRAAAAREAGEAPPPGQVRDLRIQLNPAHLGSVDARLRMTGEQLSVEIRVDSPDAYRRLSADRDAIAHSLRGLGFAVDDVSIVQQPAPSNLSQNAAGGRSGDPSAGLSEGSQREQQQHNGSAGGRARDDQQRGYDDDLRPRPPRAAGSDLYI